MSTLSTIRQEVLDDLRQDSTTGNFDTTTLNSKINRAIEMTALLSESTKQPTTWVAVANQAAYTLPSDNLLITSAYFGDPTVADDMSPLDIYTEEVLKAVNPYWLDATTSSQGRPSRLLLYDKSTVYLDPRPSSTYAGKTLKVFYIYAPASISSDSDIPGIPLAFHGVIHFYATFLCYLSLGNRDVATDYFNKWKEHYSMIKGIATRGADETFSFKFTYQED